MGKGLWLIDFQELVIPFLQAPGASGALVHFNVEGDSEFQAKFDLLVCCIADAT